MTGTGPSHRFAIDYSKCIFCHLCIDPCPKDCILMGAEYDFVGYTPEEMTLNLLTGKVETREERQVMHGPAKEGMHKAEELKKKKKEEAKKAKAAAPPPPAPPATPAPGGASA